MIAIIDYGLGNPGSILNMLKRIGVEAVITNDINTIKRAERYILPGVGSFDQGMKCLMELGLPEILHEEVIQLKKPLLGICLGMQLLAKRSEEGQLEGLGWVDAEVIKIPLNKRSIKVPHMGWNYVSVKNKNRLLKSEASDRFYFVHSYIVKCNKPENILAETLYGQWFTSVISQENIYGIQAHPEKSHTFGIQFLKRFCEL